MLRVEVVYKEIMILLMITVSIYGVTLRLDTNIVLNSVPLSNVVTFSKITISPKYGTILDIFPSNRLGFYVYTNKGFLLFLKFIHGRYVPLAYTKLEEEPLWLNDTPSHTYVLTREGTLIKYDKALILKSAKKIAENIKPNDISLVGVSSRYVYINIKDSLYALHAFNVTYLGNIYPDKVKVVYNNKYVDLPIQRLAVACNIENVISKQVYYTNGSTIVLLFEGNNRVKAIKLRLTPSQKVVLCGCVNLVNNVNNLRFILDLNNQNLYVAEEGTYETVIRPLFNNSTQFILRPPLDVSTFEFLGTYNSSLGYVSKVYLLNSYLVVARDKDHTIMLTAKGISMCLPRMLICLSKDHTLYNLNKISQPYTILEIKLTKKFLSLTRGIIFKSTIKSMDIGSSYALPLSLSKPSIQIEVPSGIYILTINTEVGRVVEFVPAPPPSWNFDPAIVSIDISPEIIVPYIYTLRIKVIDSQTKNPIPGALIQISGITVRGKNINIGPLITDANGTVKIKLEKGRYVVRVSHQYYKPLTKSILLNSDTNITIPLVVRGSQVTFIVKTKGVPPLIPPGPLSNAHIFITGPMTLNVTTNKNGMARVILRPGFYTIKVVAPMYKPYTSSLTVNPTLAHITKKIEMQPILLTVVFTILDALTKKPVVPAMLKLTDLSLPNNPSLVLRNPPSNVIKVNIPPGNYSVLITAKNYQDYRKVYNINKDATITVYLKYKTIKVKFLVYDELKRLVDHFNITLYNEYLGIKFEFKLTTESNTVDIPPGLYKVKITAPSCEPLTTEINIDENTKVIQLTIAHKTIPVTIEITTNDKLLYDYVYTCNGNIQGGPLLKPLPLPKMVKPDLKAKIKLPKGSYRVIVQCKSASGRLAATGSADFTVPLQTKVMVPIKPSKTMVTARVVDVRNNKPVSKAVVKIFYNSKLIGEGMSNINGLVRIPVNVYYIGKQVKIVITAPGYQTYESTVILTERLPVIYLKPAPTIIEIILGNPILIVIIVFAAGAGAYLISTLLGRGEEEEIFEELV